MKRLILMRHGIADDTYSGKDDYRPLTDKGREVHGKMGRWLREQNIEIDGIYHSPFERAKESAKILAQSYPKIPMKEEPALGAIFDSYTILRKIERKNYRTTLLVGHEPSLALLASHLMKEYKPFKLEKSACLVLEFDEEIKFGQGHFKFYFSPENTEK